MSEYTFKQLSNHTYYIASPSNIGIYEENGTALLIDSGIDREAGRQVLKFLKQQKWELSLIINTHSNADHTGGNAFLQKKTDCRIAATDMEAPFINFPFLEPAFLSGAYPNIRLQNKFLMAKPSTVTNIIPAEGPILDTPLQAVHLPGHFFKMIGIETPDNVFFTADSLIPENIITKYHIFYLFDIRSHFETLTMLQERENILYVPSHGEPVQDIKEMAEHNRNKMLEIMEILLSFCQTPSPVEELLAKLFIHYKLDINANQYFLLLSTIRSYLSYLLEEKKVDIIYREGRMEWAAK